MYGSLYCLLAATALLFDWPGTLSRPARRAESSSLFGHRAPRIRIHRARRPGRDSRRNIPPGNIRCDHREGKHADVPPQPQDQGNGRQDGLERRGQRRDIWR